MGVFLRTEWLADRGARLEARKRQMADLLAHPDLQTVAGGQWYEQAMSEREALLRPVNVPNPSVPKPWEDVRLSTDTRFHRLTLWNGADDECGVEVSISLRDPPGDDLDTFVVSLTRPRLLRTTRIDWEVILALCRTLAKELGGLTILSAGDLVAIAEERNLRSPDAAAYAAFWGTDRTGRDRAHASLRARGLDPPYEIVVARSWDEVFNPDSGRLHDAIELLTRQ